MTTIASRLLALLLSAAAPGIAAAQAAPFKVDQRPRPQGTSLDSLLPVKVGAFAREALPPDAKLRSDEDLNVTYGAGADSIFVGISLPESSRDAHDAVKTARDEAVASKIDLKGSSYRVGKDPSWFKTATFFSWTRGPYFFYAHAGSAGALDRFMEAYPY